MLLALRQLSASWPIDSIRAKQLVAKVERTYAEDAAGSLAQLLDPKPDDIALLLDRFPPPVIADALLKVFRGPVLEPKFLSLLELGLKQGLFKPHHDVTQIRRFGLYVSGVGPWGGIQRVVQLQAELLTAHGYQVTIIVDCKKAGEFDAVQYPPCDVLWFGRIDESVKRITEVLQVFSEVLASSPKATLNIVGESRDGMIDDRIQRRLEELDLVESVRMLPATSNVAQLLAQSRVVVITSRFESFSMVLAEAMLAAKPVVMYELPYLELARGNRGVITVPWGDSSAAAAKIAILLKDETFATQCGESGRQFVLREFNNSTMVERLVSLFSQRRENLVPEPAEELANISIWIKEIFPLFLESTVRGEELSVQLRNLEAYAHNLETERAAAAEHVENLQTHIDSLETYAHNLETERAAAAEHVENLQTHIDRLEAERSGVLAIILAVKQRAGRLLRRAN